MKLPRTPFLKYSLFKCLALLVILLPAYSSAEPAGLTMEQAKQKLLTARPDIPVTSIKAGMVDGFYEIVIGGGTTVHMNSTGDYFFAGDLFFIEAGGFVNATEKGRTDTRRELLESLDESEMVVFAPQPELTKATITVFTDIDCGYCRKLHQEVPELNRLGIAVRYLAYPRAGIGSESYDKAVSAWCADNRQVALTEAKAGKQIEQKTCANPVAKQYALGDEFGVTGTPAIVYENGTLQAGYLPALEMAARLGLN
jgi:thiol:disulfide interchange protein DsbC